MGHAASLGNPIDAWAGDRGDERRTGASIRKLMVSMAENAAAATPEQLRELILMLVE